MKTYDDFIEINQSNGNQRTQEHFESDFYNVKSFLEGKSSLNSLEIGLLEDVRDKKILHLQCHFGMDTILYRSEIWKLTEEQKQNRLIRTLENIYLEISNE